MSIFGMKHAQLRTHSISIHLITTTPNQPHRNFENKTLTVTV